MIFQTEQPYIRLVKKKKNFHSLGGILLFFYLSVLPNVCFGISSKWVKGALIVSAVYSL